MVAGLRENRVGPPGKKAKKEERRNKKESQEGGTEEQEQSEKERRKNRFLYFACQEARIAKLSCDNCSFSCKTYQFGYTGKER